MGVCSPNSHTPLRTPLPDLLIFHAVDGAVFPFRRRGGEGGAVGVAGGGVEGEDLVAGAAIDLDLALVEEGAVTRIPGVEGTIPGAGGKVPRGEVRCPASGG